MKSSGFLWGVADRADDCGTLPEEDGVSRSAADDLGVPCPVVLLDLDGLGGSCWGVDLGDSCLDASTITGIVFRAIPGDLTFTGLVC
jgi:hypothetical protein